MNIDKPIPELSVEDLNTLYRESEDADKRIFAEMRTNLQLVAGEHYVREGSKFWNRIRDDKRLSTEQRLKLTKNHIQRVTKVYRNMIESAAPGVAFMPANEQELADLKQAEMDASYWTYIKSCQNVDGKIAMWIQNFVEIGEVCTKVFWDMDGGQVVGYEAVMVEDPATGEMIPAMHPTSQQPIQSENPVYGGKCSFEMFEAYNLKRDKDSKSMEESPFHAIAKLMPRLALRRYLTKDDDIKKFDSMPTTEYTIYDNNTNSYRIARDQVLIKEFYWKPGPAIRNGYFQIVSGDFMISQGELPYGIYPIVWEGFDTQSGNARAHSIIRHARPPQIEINRCASKMAEHQTTIGDDKVWMPMGMKVTQGAMLPGVRVNYYSGGKPEVTPGRSGDQYLPVIDQNINELYQLVHLEELVEEAGDNNDLMTNLYKSARFKKKFAIYAEKFERFLKEVVTTAIKISKKSANEEEVVAAIGKSERINMVEFKKNEDIHYQVRIQPRSGDIDSEYGKQIIINHILQYVGNQMPKEDIGMLIRNSPFLNKEKMFQKFTQKYDRIVNDILALDRGQWRPPRKYDDHDYILEQLSLRMGQQDYEQLPQPVQMLYDEKMAQHEQMKEQQILALQRAQSGFIPSGGYLVTCDLYRKDEMDPTKTKRVKLPSESLNWLIDKLGSQGLEITELGKMNKGVLEEIAGMMTEPQGESLGELNAVA